ncbi:hypothetical protein D3C78_1789820 [compost metagenome]
MIDAQTGVGLPMLPKVIPKRIEPILGIQMPQRIGPALIEQALITLAALGLQ